MSISNILKEIAANTPFFKGVILIGTEGFTVANYHFDDSELESFVIEFLGMIKKLEHLMDSKGLGTPRAITINGDKVNYILNRVTPNYFLFLGFGVEANTGKCNYEIKKATLDLKLELNH